MSTETRSELEVRTDPLETARQRVEPALRATLDRLPEAVRPVALYHYGWRDTEGHEDDAGRGKALRPALTLLSAQAVAPHSNPEEVIAAAVAVDWCTTSRCCTTM